ncbi:hypothetical protein [Microbacterium maritypicum]
MAEDKTPKSFDAILGSLIMSLSRDQGGRQFLADLLGYNPKTISRRSVGDGEYTVRELNIVANKIGMTAEEILNLALRKYSGGTAAEGVHKLVAEDTVSEAPTNLAAHRKSKMTPKDMSDPDQEGIPNAADSDPDIGGDEPGTA